MALKDSYTEEFKETDPGYLQRKNEFQNILEEALSNNTFDYVPMHAELRRIYDNAFSSTMRYQHSLQGYTESFFFSNDDSHYKDDTPDIKRDWKQDVVRSGNLYVDEHGYACLDYEYPFISVANREDFRRSRFYKKWFSFEDVINNHRLTDRGYYLPDGETHSIFTKVPVLIIDNHVIFDYKMYVDRSYIKFRLPFKSDFVYRHERNLSEDRLYYVDHQITIQMIDNIFWTSRNDITVNASASANLLETIHISDGYLSIPTSEFVDDVTFKKLYDVFPHQLANYHGLYMATINIPSSTYPELGSFLLDTTVSDDVIRIKLDPLIAAQLNIPGNSTNFTVNIIWYNDLYKHTFFNGDDFTVADHMNTCMIPVIQEDELVPYDMPVPIENMMIVRTAQPMRVDVITDSIFARNRESRERFNDVDGVLYYVTSNDTYYTRRNGEWTTVSEFFVTGGRSISENTKTVTLHYPNIYEITDKARTPGDTYEIYYFYRSEDIFNYKYTPLTAFYHYYLKYAFSPNKNPSEIASIEEVISTIVNNRRYTVPGRLEQLSDPRDNMNADQINAFNEYFSRVYNYNIYDYIYGDVDFYHKFVSPNRFYNPENPDIEDLSDDVYPVEYKIARLREWIRTDQDYLRHYVASQKNLGKIVHLFVKYLRGECLSSRIRTDVTQEDPGSDVVLSTESYVFTLACEDPSVENSMIIWVDGLMVMDFYQFNFEDKTYVYIPTNMVTDDSYIEIELRPRYEFTQKVEFTSLGDEKEIILISPNDGIFPTSADLIVTDDKVTNHEAEFESFTVTDNTTGIPSSDSLDVGNMLSSSLNTYGEIPANTSVILDIGKPTVIVGIDIVCSGGTGAVLDTLIHLCDDNGNWEKIATLGSSQTFGRITVASNTISDTGSGTINLTNMVGKYNKLRITTPADTTVRVNNIKVMQRPYPTEVVDHVYDSTFFKITSWYENLERRPKYKKCALDNPDRVLVVDDRMNNLDQPTVHINDVLPYIPDIQAGDSVVYIGVNKAYNTWVEANMHSHPDDYDCNIPHEIIDHVNDDNQPEDNSWDIHNKQHIPAIFTRVLKFRIKPLSDEVVNVPLKIRFSKVPDLMRVTMSHTGIPYLSLIDRDFKRNSGYIRVFREGKLLDRENYDILPEGKDGRLYPREKYQFTSSFDHPRLRIYDIFDRGEIFYVDISPFRYKEIYHKEHLEPGEFVVDLSGIITKPMDYRYYDVYLNGRRLSLPNIISVDAWSITLVNLFSDAHLQIFEKERDWEYFGLNYKEKNVFFFSKEDILDADYMDEATRNHLLSYIIDERAEEEDFNVHENIIAEKEMDFTDFSAFYNSLIFYTDELIPKTSVNPDYFQSARDILIEEYNATYQKYKASDGKVDTMLLDPDNITKPGGVPETTNGEPVSSDLEQVVEVIGHAGDIPDEFLDQKIAMKTQNPIGGE